MSRRRLLCQTGYHHLRRAYLTNPLPIELAGDRKQNLKQSLCRKKTDESKTISEHMVFTHFPKDPKTCKMTRSTRARCQNRSEMRRDGMALPKKFGEVLTADHKVVSEDSQ